MANLLRTLLVVMFLGLVLTILAAHRFFNLEYSHIKLAIPFFLYTLFCQAFIMFYFIGVNRLTENVKNLLQTQQLHELFENPPEDITPYHKKVDQFMYESTLYKRKVIPWTMLILLLGMLAFLLGGAHDTGMVTKIIHSGVVYGLFMAACIGTFQQWKNLGKAHRLLKELKNTFSLPHQQM